MFCFFLRTCVTAQRECVSSARWRNPGDHIYFWSRRKHTRLGKKKWPDCCSDVEGVSRCRSGGGVYKKKIPFNRWSASKRHSPYTRERCVTRWCCQRNQTPSPLRWRRSKSYHRLPPRCPWAGSLVCKRSQQRLGLKKGEEKKKNVLMRHLGTFTRWYAESILALLVPWSQLSEFSVFREVPWLRVL